MIGERKYRICFFSEGCLSPRKIAALYFWTKQFSDLAALLFPHFHHLSNHIIPDISNFHIYLFIIHICNYSEPVQYLLLVLILTFRAAVLQLQLTYASPIFSLPKIVDFLGKNSTCVKHYSIIWTVIC